MLALRSVPGTSFSQCIFRIVSKAHVRPHVRLQRRVACAIAGLALPVAAVFTVTVHNGDTLSGLTQRYCHSAADWTGTYEANKAVIRNPNLIYTGQQLKIVCTTAGVQQTSTAAVVHTASGGRVWDVTYGYPNYCGDGDGDGYDLSCAQLHHSAGTAQPAQPSPVYQSGSSGGGSVVQPFGSSFQQCVISHESGGNSQVMNSTGHYGLYQFSYQTWVGGGGNPGDFGHASVSEQNQVFASVYAQDGTSPWAPYDGC